MGNGELVKHESSLGQIRITSDQVELVKNTVATGATDDELKLFFYECTRRGVHPLDRLIHFVKRGSKVAFQCGIDYMRSEAQATGQYRGQKDIDFGDLKPIEDFPEIKAPEWARVTVRRWDPERQEMDEVTVTSWWDEFYPGKDLGFIWRKMPRVMLGKCTEAQALRKAFPRQLSGLYTFEEMEQAGIIDIGKTPLKEPQAKPAAALSQADADKITEPQRKKIWAILHKTHSTDEEKRAKVAEILGLEKVESLNSLTKRDASVVIEALQKVEQSDKEPF